VPHPGPPAARGHLRLASLPVAPRPRDSRALLHGRAIAAALALFLVTLLAWMSSAVALLPLLWRRAPHGARLRPFRTREARVIQFQPRQKALPR
jgi:hypothetical protein